MTESSDIALPMVAALKRHWPEYLMEAAELGCFMISAGLFAILLYHPSSPAVRSIPSEFARRTLMGLAMGVTAVAIIYSPWGRRSGAHMNPAVTLAFYHLGKVARWDAVFYILAQFLGAIGGILLLSLVTGGLLAHSSINYVATLPGASGAWAAFSAEVAISFVLLSVVLTVSNHPELARYTGLSAGLCVAAFITFEAPISGMSMNPARTFGSAVLPELWSSLWVYFLAPPAGMWIAAAVHLRRNRPVGCAKLHHQNTDRCIFCEFHAAAVRKSGFFRPTATMKILSAVCLLAAGLTLSASARTNSLQNLDKSGVAIQGYDPVAFFTDRKPVKGKPELSANHAGATYYFASQEHKDLFTKNPARYEPEFGGFCAYGVSKNKLVGIDVTAFDIVEDRLLLQYNKGARDDFNKDRKGNLARARANWPRLVDEKGK